MPIDARLINLDTPNPIETENILASRAKSLLAGGFYGTPDDPQSASPYLTQYLPPKQKEYTQSEQAKAAWERENEIGSFIAQQTSGFRFNNDPDPDFDITDYVLNEVNNTDYAPYAENFLEFKNRQNAELYKKHLDKEFKNTEILQNSGWSGLAWGIGASLLSPVNLIPIGGSAYKAYKAGQITKGIALTAGAGALSMTTSEALLQSSQETRGLGESVMNVGAGTILAGVLGGASAMLNKNKFNSLAKKIEKEIQNDEPNFKFNLDTQNVEIKTTENLKADQILKEPQVANLKKPSAVEMVIDTKDLNTNAKKIELLDNFKKQYNDVYLPEIKAKGETPLPYKDYLKQQTALMPTIIGDVASALRIEKLTKKINLLNNLNPIQRLTRTEFAVKPKEFAQKLMKTGLYFNKNAEGIANYQSAEIAKKATMADYVHSYRPIEDKAYSAFKQRLKTQEGTEFDKTINNDLDFFAELSRAMRNNDFSNIPEIAKMAKVARFIINKLSQEAVNVKILGEDVIKNKPQTAMSYFPRLWNKRKIVANENGLRDLLTYKIKNVVLPQLKQTQFEDFAKITDEDQYISEVVDDIMFKLKGEDRMGVVDDFLIKIDKRGPLKERTLYFIMDNEAEPWLENDARKVMAYYSNTLATDIEIARAFDGDLTLSNATEEISKEYDELIKKTNDETLLKKIDKEKKSVINDLTSTAQIMRGIYARPDNPDSVIVRGARIARQYNYITKMGQVVLSSISDLSRPIAKHGLKSWAKTLPNLITNLKGIKLNVKDAKLAGNITDIAMPERMASFSGLHDTYASNASTFERYVDNISSFMSKYNLMPLWNDSMKSFSSVMTQQRMIENILNYKKADKKNITYLAQIGIGKDNVEAIAKELKKNSYKEGRLYVANTEKWQNKEALRMYQNALNTDVDSTIITMGAGDLPLWGNTEVGKIILQFRSFAFASTQQTLMAGLQQKDVAILNGFISATSLGMLAYYFKKKLAGKEPSDDPAVWIREGIDRGGYLSILSEYSNIADKAGLGASNLFGLEESSRFASRNAAASLLGPSISLVNDGFTAGRALTSGQIAPADARAVRRMIILNNHWLLTKAMDNLEEKLVNTE